MHPGQMVTTVWRRPVVGALSHRHDRDGKAGWFVNWADGLCNDWCPESILILVVDETK